MLKNIFFAHNQEEDRSRIAFGESRAQASETVEAELPIDLIRAGNKFIIRTPIVGASADDIHIALEENRITITKNSLSEESDENEYYYLQECHWGPLSRTVELPKDIDGDNIQASLQDGILSITLPLLTKSFTKVINVKDHSDES